MFAFTVRQIEVFLAVCEEQSFRRAADRLGVSEAAVSHHIRALERQLDCTLFSRRRGARITLLESGAAFRVEAQSFAERGRELRTLASRHSTRQRPLRAFVGGHLLEDYVRPALPQFASAHPDITLEFDVHRSREQVRDDVLAGEFDLVLMSVRHEEDLPNSMLIAPVEGGVYGTAAFVEPAKSGLHHLPFILGPLGSLEHFSELRTLTRIGISRPIIALRTQFHDARILSAIEGLGVTFSLQSIVDKYDTGRVLHMLTRFDDWQVRLFLSERLAVETRVAVEEFVKSIIPARAKRFVLPSGEEEIGGDSESLD